MGYYENIRCGKCKYSFTDGYASANGFMKTSLGVPYLKCPDCGTVNKTKLAPYSAFHVIEKIYFWISTIIRYIVFFGVILFVLFSYLFNFSMLASVLFALSISLSIAIYFGLSEIREVEKQYEDIT